MGSYTYSFPGRPPATDTATPQKTAGDITTSVIRWVCEAANPQFIFLRSFADPVQPEQVHKELLVVLPDTLQLSYAGYEALLDLYSNGRQHFSFSIIQRQALQTKLQEAQLWYRTFCRPENKVYDAGGAPLLLSAPEIIEESVAAAKAIFEAGYQKAADFLHGSTAFMDQEHQRGLELFMIQQCMEQLLRAVLLSLTGREVKCHEISVLLRHCRKYALPLCKLLPGGNPQEDRLLQLLDAAYLKTRYCPQPLFIAEHEPDMLQSCAREMMAMAQEYMYTLHL